MATKKTTLEQAVKGEGCLGRCADDEPVFVLCARDPIALPLIKRWVRRRAFHNNGESDQKIKDAEAVVREFRDWQKKHNVGQQPKDGR